MYGKNVLLKTICGLTALAIATPALAIMSVPAGWYLEANVGSSRLTNKSYPSNSSSSSSGIGGNANLGYKFMPFLAIEMGYTRYANTVIKDSGGTKAATDVHYSYDLAAKGILPIIDSGLEFFAKVGAGRLNSHVSLNNATAASNIGISSSQHSATGLYTGIGAQYYVMPELALVVQWQRSQGSSSTGNQDLFSGGASFIFD